jgi:hypothetical protein
MRGAGGFLQFDSARVKGHSAMAKDDFFNRLYGIAPPPTFSSKLSDLFASPEAPPAPPVSISKLLGMLPPPEPPALGNLRAISSLFATPPAPLPAPAPFGIRFADSHFSEPTVFSSAGLPSLPGIYAILVWDFLGKPRPFRVLYFGKAEDLHARVTPSHEKYNGWWQAARGAGALYVAYHLMPNTGDGERATLEESLIKAYAPECNRTFNPLAGLFGS